MKVAQLDEKTERYTVLMVSFTNRYAFTLCVQDPVGEPQHQTAGRLAASFSTVLPCHIRDETLHVHADTRAALAESSRVHVLLIKLKGREKSIE